MSPTVKSHTSCALVPLAYIKHSKVLSLNLISLLESGNSNRVLTSSLVNELLPLRGTFFFGTFSTQFLKVTAEPKSLFGVSRRETWTGQILLLDAGDGWYEAEINGRGTYFHILAGRHKYGNYLCVPNHDVGCELSDFSDIFWNEERIGSLMRKVDAVTVATGLVHLPALAAGQLKN